MSMKTIAAASFAALSIIGVANAKPVKQSRPSTAAQAENAPTTNVALPSTGLKFGSTGITDRNGYGPILAAPAYGDLTKGEHSTYIRMPAGFDGAAHIHTNDFWVAVVSGVAVNTAVGGEDVPLPPGSFWFQPGGKPHYTKCISQVECVFFVNQNGPFDYIKVDK